MGLSKAIFREAATTWDCSLFFSVTIQLNSDLNEISNALDKFIARQLYIELPANQFYYDFQIEGITEMSPVIATRSYDINTESPTEIYVVSNGIPSPGTLRVKFNKAPTVNTSMRVSLIYKLN